MKKVISLMLALVLALSLTACGGKASGPEGVVDQFCKGLQELDEKAIAQCFDRCVALAVYLGQMLHTKNFHDCLPLGYPAPPDAPGLLRGCPRHAFSIRRRGDGPVTASVTVLSHDGFVKTQGEPAAPFGGALREDFAVLPG